MCAFLAWGPVQWPTEKVKNLQVSVSVPSAIRSNFRYGNSFTRQLRQRSRRRSSENVEGFDGIQIAHTSGTHVRIGRVNA